MRAARRALMRTERDLLSFSFAHRCASCSALLQPGWHADHILPLADGGPHEMQNMQPLCAPCHTLKTAGENSARAARAVSVTVHRTREIALTEKCTAAFAVWIARGEQFRAPRPRPGSPPLS